MAFALAAAVASAASAPAGGETAPRWSVEKAKAWAAENPWWCGVNYIPANAINYTAMWDKTSFSPDVIRRELKLMTDMGMNCVRFVMQYKVYEDDPQYFVKTLDAFLALCDEAKVKAMPIFFDDCVFGANTDPVLGRQPEPLEGWYAWAWSPSPGLTMVIDEREHPKLEKYVKEVMTRFKDDKRIFLWDLYNEPTSGRLKERSFPLLRKTFAWAREVDPSQPITSGAWNGNKALNEILLANSDVVTFHCYKNAKETAADIKRLKASGRPVICTEWMCRPRKSTVRDCIGVFADADAGCVLWGLVNGKTQTHLPWGHRPENLPFAGVWQHDLYHGDFTPYDPAEIDLIKKTINRKAAASPPPFVSEIQLLDGEVWWGGGGGDGQNQPYGASGSRRIDLRRHGHTSAPLLVSSRGRCVWSEKPFAYQFRDGKLVVESDVEKVVATAAGSTLKEAYLAAAKAHFRFEGKAPPDVFFALPQWNDWMEIFLCGMDQKTTDAYTEELAKSGFPCGIYMMDGGWMTHQGSYEFYAKDFPDPKGMVGRIRSHGWTPMIWTAHFVSPDSREYKKLRHNPTLDGLDYLAYSRKSQSRDAAIVRWWSGASAIYDLTKPEANAFYAKTLKDFAAEYGIAGFKFDAGDPKFFKDCRFHDETAEPVDYQRLYAELAAREFPYNEVRGSWKCGGLPLVTRLKDKAHAWTAWEGRQAQDVVIPQVVAAGMVGCPYVVADMVGGGLEISLAHREIDEKLFVRSAAMNALLPMMQFSLLPWRRLSPENAELCRKFAALHVAFAPYILELAHHAAKTGEPIVRAMEYEFPHQGFNRPMLQFMLGSKWLVAPVTTPDDKKTVELPAGEWRDDLGETHVGPKTLRLENVPLDRLPRYERMRGSDAAIERFFREYADGTAERLPSWVEPCPVFMTLSNIELAPGGEKITRRIFEHVRDRTGANVLAYSPRCRLDLSDAEFMRRVKEGVEFFKGSGVQFQVQIDPRLFRNEFLAKWPDDCLHLRQFAVAKPDAAGAADFEIVQEMMWDHTCYGSKDRFSGWKPGRLVSLRAVRGGDLASARDVTADALQCTTNSVAGRVRGLAPDETLLAEADFPLKEIDPLSPRLPDFTREIALRYKALGIGGFYMDEFGFQTPKSAMLEHRAVWHSPRFAQAYAERSGGRDLAHDAAAFALGGGSSPALHAAANAYFRTIHDACVAYERFCCDTVKELFGDDAYVGKHPTWWGQLGNRREFFHNGLDWWAVPRDWANTDENVPVAVATALSKKFGSPLWLNEGYGRDPKHYLTTMWRYAPCGGRMSWHAIVGTAKTDYRNRMYKDPKERRYRIFADMLCQDAVRAGEILRLLPLVSRAPIDCPVAHVFGHERLMDRHDSAYEDWGKTLAHALGRMGWYADAYPASEIAAGTFKIGSDGFLRVGRQRYVAATLCNLSDGERAAWERFAGTGKLKTQVFFDPQPEEVAKCLEASGAARQTPFGKTGFWGGTDNLLPPSDGVMRLTDGTVVRIKGGRPDFAGDEIEGEIKTGGVRVKFKARGMFAARAENGTLAAIAGGEVSYAEAPGFSLALSTPEDLALVKLPDGWHGVWQTSQPASALPAALRPLAPHWTRLPRVE